GPEQEPVLLLWVRARWRRDSFRRTVSRREIPTGHGTLAALASGGVPTRGRDQVLPSAATSAHRSHRVSVSTRATPARSHRGVGHRLRAGPMPTRLADDFGLPTTLSPASRSGERGRTGHARPSHRISAGRESIWTQYRGCGTPPVSPGRQGRVIPLGESSTAPGDHSGRGDVRSHCAVAGRI